MRFWRRVMVVSLGLMGMAALPAAAGPAEKKPTRVMVRVLSRDAKLIGDKVGGARVIIRDADSGKVLADGLQKGGSGDTEKIIKEPWARGVDHLDTPGAAGFLTTLELDRPTRVEVIAEGPLDTPQSTYQASKTLLLIPGQDVLGNGIVLEIHGFRIRFEAPAADLEARVGEPVKVRIEMTLA